jgi:ribosomal 50S subunit-associated protein YjgA (DUF615 family)
MARRKRMIDTSVPEEEVDPASSRTKQRAVRKDLQERLESLGAALAKLPPKKLAPFELGEELEREIISFASMRKGSALARQRKRVAGLLRPLDLDAIEARLIALSKR